MFNRSVLYVPTLSPTLKRWSIVDPAAPAALSDLVIALDIEIVSIGRFSNGDLALLDQKAGRLVRATVAGVITWNVDCREATEVPAQLAVDGSDRVWVAYDEGKVARFSSAGSLQSRLDETDGMTIQASTATFVVLYDQEAGRIVLVDQVSGTLAGEALVSDLSSNHEPCAVSQLGMVEEKFYLPVRRKESCSVSPGKYEILEIAETTLLSVLPLSWTRALRGTLCDEDGNIYAIDEFSTFFQFNSSIILVALFSLESRGRLDAIALSADGLTPYVISDDTLGQARLHTIDLDSGVPSYLDFTPGPEFRGGDLAGYQRATLVADPDVAGLAPTVDAAKISALVLPGSPGSTVITGKPGAVLDATSVSCSVGSATVEEDGSFAITGSSMAPGNVTLTFTGPGGTTPQVVAAAAHAETATSAQFHGTKFGIDGGYLQLSLADGSGQITTGTHFVRIRDLATGKYWNGESFVASNGLFCALAHQQSGLWTYRFEPEVEGQYAAIFNENAIYAFDAVQTTKEKQESAETLSKLNEMSAPGAALLAPTGLFTAESTVGGFILGRLARLQFLLNILSIKAQVVFPKMIEGIGAIVNRTFLKKSDTPLILITILDAVTGEALPITGHTIRFRAALQPGAAPIFDRELEIVDAEHGQCQIRLTALDTGTAGSFMAEIKDLSPDGVVLTTANFNLVISQGL